MKSVHAQGLNPSRLSVQFQVPKSVPNDKSYDQLIISLTKTPILTFPSSINESKVLFSNGIN